MPMYLKRDAIRFIEASVSAISMAVAALGMPRRYDLEKWLLKMLLLLDLLV